MADYPIPTQLVVDERLVPAANAQVTVYDLNDTNNTTPLNLKDLNGNPVPNPIRTTANALSPAILSPVPKVKFVAPSTGLAIPVTSLDGLESSAQAAADRADAAQQSAQQAVANATAPTDTAVRDRINDTASQTRAALNATFVRFVDENGAPLTSRHVVIKVNSTTGEIIDIVSEA